MLATARSFLGANSAGPSAYAATAASRAAQSRPGDAPMRPVRESDAQMLIEAVGRQLPLGFTGGKIVVAGRPLEFHPGASLLALTDFGARPAVTRHALHHPSAVILMDGTADRILEFNDAVGLSLDAASIAPYLRFFFSMLDDPAVPFRLIERVEDLPLRTPPGTVLRFDLDVLVQPLTLHRAGGSFDFVMGGSFLFKDALIGAEIGINRDGEVRLFGETVLIEKIPGCTLPTLRRAV